MVRRPLATVENSIGGTNPAQGSISLKLPNLVCQTNNHLILGSPLKKPLGPGRKDGREGGPPHPRAYRGLSSEKAVKPGTGRERGREASLQGRISNLSPAVTSSSSSFPSQAFLFPLLSKPAMMALLIMMMMAQTHAPHPPQRLLLLCRI